MPLLAIGCTSGVPVGDRAESSQDRSDWYEVVSGGVVRIEVSACGENYIGGGILVDESHVLTVAHNVGDTDEIYLIQGEDVAKGEVIGLDNDRDIALNQTCSNWLIHIPA